jgi:hypothetical protein
LTTALARALRIDEAMATVRQARVIAEAVGNNTTAIHAKRQEGLLLCHQGRLNDAIVLQDEAWSAAEFSENAFVLFICAWTRSFREREYRANPREAVALALRELNRPLVSQTLIQKKTLMIQLACAFFWCGDRARLDALDLPRDEIATLHLDFDGRWSESVEVNLNQRPQYAKEGNKAAEGWRLQTAGFSLHAMGQLDGAATILSDAVEVFRCGDVEAELRNRTALCLVRPNWGRSERLAKSFPDVTRFYPPVKIGEGKEHESNWPAVRP